MNNLQQADIFVSYSRIDKQIVHSIADSLRRNGNKIWTDVSGIAGGAVWLTEIENAIKSCEMVLVMISSASKESKWVTNEVLYALDHKKPIIPILIEQTSMPLFLVRLQPIEYYADPNKAINNLLEILPPKPILTSAQGIKSVVENEPKVLKSFVSFRRFLGKLQHSGSE